MTAYKQSAQFYIKVDSLMAISKIELDFHIDN